MPKRFSNLYGALMDAVSKHGFIPIWHRAVRVRGVTRKRSPIGLLFDTADIR